MESDKSLVPDGHGRAVSRKEFEEVIRRATELATAEPDAGTTALTEAEVYRIAQEVGLPTKHVERALSEVRGASPMPGGIRACGRLLGQRLTSRPRESGRGRKAIDEFMVSGRLLHPVRQSDELLVYWPAVDWASQIARAASATGKKYYVASAKRVEVGLRPMTRQHHVVELRVDPGIRNDSVGGAVFGGGILGVAAGVESRSSSFGRANCSRNRSGRGPGGAVTGWDAALVSRAYRNQVEKVRLEIQGILDQLERGEIPSPPPPSWSRWVSRRFRGIAREIARSAEEIMD